MPWHALPRNLLETSLDEVATPNYETGVEDTAEGTERLAFYPDHDEEDDELWCPGSNQPLTDADVDATRVGSTVKRVRCAQCARSVTVYTVKKPVPGWRKSSH
jgi:hypothetical protein